MLRIIKIVTSKTYVQKALILNGFFMLAQPPGERERTISIRQIRQSLAPPKFRSIRYVIVIPWARVVCLIYTPEARGPQARGLRVYISGKSRVPMA